MTESSTKRQPKPKPKLKCCKCGMVLKPGETPWVKVLPSGSEQRWHTVCPNG